MEYLYDPHTHTKEVSRCGWIPAQEVVNLYHSRGYAGIAVTDHLHEGYISTLPCRDDWQACVSAYMAGYHLSRQKAQEYGMDSIFGAEIRFPENDRDYLIYGIDEDFLRRNPYLHRLGHRAFYEKFKNEVLMIQAHPYRDFDRLGEDVASDWLHGVETLNSNPRHDSQNSLAEALCREKPHLYAVCGSDTHRPGDEAQAAMVFHHRVRDSFEYKAAVQSGEYSLRNLAQT